jgi:hypothetical protein
MIVRPASEPRFDQRLDQNRFAARTAENPRIASNLALAHKYQKPIIAAFKSVIGFLEVATNTAATVDH